MCRHVVGAFSSGKNEQSYQESLVVDSQYVNLLVMIERKKLLKMNTILSLY